LHQKIEIEDIKTVKTNQTKVEQETQLCWYAERRTIKYHLRSELWNNKSQKAGFLPTVAELTRMGVYRDVKVL